MSQQTKVAGVILAGGRARRMDGQDKGLLTFNGQPLISYAVDAMRTIADYPMINANRSLNEYENFGLPVISDATNDFNGPLAGVLAGLTCALSAGCDELLVMPCDSPCFQAAHLRHLLTCKRDSQADIAVAFDGEKLHPVFLALNPGLKPSLETYLAQGGRKVETWLIEHHAVRADFSESPEIFNNINTMEELTEFQIKNE